jgi:hypothetical protein
MDMELATVEQRRAPRYTVEHSAELSASGGSPQLVELLNISSGGGRASLSHAAAAGLGLPMVRSFGFRIWLPGDAEDAPLEGSAEVVYIEEAQDGRGQLVGLRFLEWAGEGHQRLASFIETCLRYGE